MISDANAGPATARSSFYIVMGLVALAVAVTGFSTTYFLPVAGGRFDAPMVVHVHGLAAFTWILLFLMQPSLIRMDAFAWHRIVGVFGVAVAGVCFAGGIATGLYAAERDIAAGLADLGAASIVGTITSLSIFLGLVVAGVLNRHQPEIHKRLMLLATLILLWPAWFRFRHLFPDVPHPEYLFAVGASQSLIVLAMVRDWLVEKRVHPVYLFAGIPIMIEQALEAVFFASPAWTDAGWVIFRLLGGRG